MLSGRNSTRRSRNIGTARQGHGQNNKLVIPDRNYPEPVFYFEDLGNYQCDMRTVSGRSITFLVEENRAGCYHACSVDDIVHILNFVPAGDWATIGLFVLRQPKRKEEILRPSWGMWHPAVDIGSHSGEAIFLYSVDRDLTIRWSKSLCPEDAKELVRLREDGHIVTETKRHHVVEVTLESSRNHLLYRTLLHEIGHAVDCERDPVAFGTKCSSDKEAFAHRYAATLAENLRSQGVIPFPRKI